MSEKWETVPTRSLKKPVYKSNGTSKQKADNPGQFDAPKAPVFEEKSQYELLAAKEKKEQKQKGSEPKKNSGTPKSKSGIPRLQKKDGGSKKSGQKLKLETAVPSILGQQFEEIYSKSQSLFKDSPLIWLKELTGQLNSRLDEIPISTDPVFSDHPEDYPSSLLKPDVRKVFNRSVNECSNELLQVFIEQLIQSVMTEMGKGLSVYGYQIVAQLLGKLKPDLFSQNASKYLDLIVNNKNVPAKCLTLMWILGQGGCHDVKCGLKVWSSIMLHVVSIKTLAPYCIGYLGGILKRAGSKVEQGYSTIDMKNYFLILDAVFATNSNLQPSLQKQLKEYYPVLKKLAFGKTPQKSMQRFFPQFLMKLSKEGAKTDLQRELLENVLSCLVSDTQCFNIWSQIYSKNLVQSSVLLNYLIDHLQINSRLGLDYNILSKTVKSFSATNLELNRSVPGLEACVLACARFEQIHVTEMEGGVSSAKMVVTLCLLAIAGGIVFDSYQSGSFKGSRTQKFLADTGVEALASKLFSHIFSYLSVVAGYLFKNIPKWTEAAMIYVEPALDVLWNYSIKSIKYLINISEPARAWLAENVPYFIDGVIMHPIWGVLYEYMMAFWLIIKPFVEIVLQYCNSMMDKVKITLSHYIS